MTGYGFGLYSESDPYTTRVLPNSGHLRVTVNPSQATVDYVDTSTAAVNYSYTIPPGSSAPTAETISYLGSLGTAVSKTSGTELVITTTLAVSSGDDILVAIATDPNSSLVVSITDAAGNSYSQVGATVISSGNVRTYLFAAYNVNAMATGSSLTITASPAVTARAAVAALFRGLDDNNPLDQTASATGSSTAPSSGATATTAQADELLIGVVGTEGPDGDAPGAWDGSFTTGPRLGTAGGTADTNITVSLGYRIVLSTGAYTASKTGITSRDWGAMIATFGTTPAPLPPVDLNILLGRPEDTSITANIIPDQDVEFYIERGTTSGSYTVQTATYSATASTPIEFAITGLAANTRYYYRIVYRRTGTSEWNNGAEHSFMTQRATGSSFVFTMVSDSHLGQYGGQTVDEKALYDTTLANIEADGPDFHIDNGDTFAMDPSPLGSGMTVAEADAAYYIQRPPLSAITDAIPLFLVIGNHENEEGWNWDDTFTSPDQSLAIVGIQARKKYFPNPIPDSFYTGNTDPLPQPYGGDTNREDYYAFTWGDALFVMIDPYHYSMTWPAEDGDYGGEGQDGEVKGDRWDWTLGIQQYLWLKSTLENSDATFLFVFTHHVTGGATPYGRGGIEAAPYFEWGGKNADGTWGWDTNRPAAAGWTVPVHQLMVDNGVDIFFHGHDHDYARETLDGIVYLECPKPDDAGYTWEPYSYGHNEGLYPNAIVELTNSGYLRVSVSPGETQVEYVRSYLPGDGTNKIVADSVIVSGVPPTDYTLSANSGGNGTVNLNPSGGVYGSGTTVTLTPVPSAGYQFSSWSGANSGDVINTGGVYTIVMNGNKTVQANFSPASYTLSVTLSGAGSVTSVPAGIDCGATCEATYPYNTSVTLTAVADAGSTFTGWSGACSGTGTCQVTMTAARSVAAVFTLDTAITHNISLAAGWNLVSFKVHPSNTAIASVLASVAGNYSLVFAWDTSVAGGQWLKYDPNGPGYQNTLSDLDETLGFWIKVNAVGTLAVSGSDPGTSNIEPGERLEPGRLPLRQRPGHAGGADRARRQRPGPGLCLPRQRPQRPVEKIRPGGVHRQ